MTVTCSKLFRTLTLPSVLILMLGCIPALLATDQCPELAPEEEKNVWLRYWQLETQLHWSFWLVPDIRKNSETTLKTVDREYLNVNHTYVYGPKKCPKSRRFFDIQPDCPVYYLMQHDSKRIPQNIIHAVCSCDRCRHSQSNEKGCTPVYTYTRVMRRLGSCEFEPVLEAVPVACTCTSKIKFLPAGK